MNNSTPIRTKTHAPREYFEFYHRLGTSSFYSIVETAGWRERRTGPTKFAIDQGILIVAPCGRRNLYHIEKTRKLLNSGGCEQRDKVKAILNVIQQIRRTKEKRRPSLFVLLKRQMDNLPQTALQRLATEMRKCGINPTTPFD